MTYTIMGQDIMKEINIRLLNSMLNNNRIIPDDAPVTFLMPISLTRWSILNNTSPNNPMHAIKRAISET